MHGAMSIARMDGGLGTDARNSRPRGCCPPPPLRAYVGWPCFAPAAVGPEMACFRPTGMTDLFAFYLLFFPESLDFAPLTRRRIADGAGREHDG